MSRYIDLTLTLKDGMRGVGIDSVRKLETDGWNASTFHLYSHCGTHMDAPLHFNVVTGINTIDAIPVDRFFVDAWLVDLKDIADRALIKVEHLGAIKDQIKAGEGLLFRTNWSQYVYLDKYRNDLPRISLELTKWCIDHKIAFIGVEPPSVADVNNIEELTEIHQLLLGSDIIIVEGLTNLDKITQAKVKVVALPIKVENADGAPARVIAIEN